MYKTIITGVTGDFYRVHQVVAAYVEGHHTWRQDGPTVTVLSTEKPTGELVDGTALGSFKVAALEAGDEFPVMLRVCAAKHEKNKYVQVAYDDVSAWVATRLSGFEVVDVVCAPENTSTAQKSGHKITVTSYQVSAVVKVVDVELADRALSAGIGRARRFGFGMLLVCR